jgi:zinc/manganese transport system substrate-binding protein
MKEKSPKIIIIEIILTIVAVGQIILSFVLYDKDGNSIIRNIGWIALCMSAIFGWLPIFAFKKYGKVPKGKGYVHTTQLVDRGVYAIVRHPQYVAGILMAIALFLIAQHWIIGLLGVILIVIYYLSAFDEEKATLEKLGEEYQNYMNTVPRFNFLAGLIKRFNKEHDMKNAKLFSITLILTLFLSSNLLAQHHQRREHHQRRHGDNVLKIVCSFSDYATIAEFIVQDNGTVDYIASGQEDPHFVPPKPSFAMKLRDADMWVTTGMDLEMWAPTLLDKARNKKIMDGEVGFVAVSDAVKVLEKVEKADRTEGDIHLMGNPHITTGPLNWKIIADNLTIGLRKVDPDNSEFYIAQRDKFKDKVDRSLFGDELVDMFGGETLCKLLENKTLFTFLDKEYGDGKLIDKLGGWLKKALPFRGKKIVAYHKNWSYFADTFGLELVGYIEPKPGIPPSAKHVQNMINLIQDQHIEIMLVANYFEKKSPQMIEAKTGVKALFLPLQVYGNPEVTDNFKLVDYWIDQINANIF